MKKFLGVILSVVILAGAGYAGNQKIATAGETGAGELHLFSMSGCPHCAHAKSFLETFKQENIPDLKINEHDIGRNAALAEEFYQDYSVPADQRGLVPAIFVGDRYFVGFNDQIGREIGNYLRGENQAPQNSHFTSLPILGEVDVKSFSLPALAIILGAVDGFNVCSLGALIIILGLVIVFRSRKRIIVLGGTFIVITAAVYGALVFAWHQVFSFLAPYVRSMETLIGLLALAGGVYLLREFYQARKKGPVCGSNNLMSRLTPKVDKIFKKKAGWPILLGVVAMFAAIVTVVEFPCSAFLPVLFAGILVESGVSTAMAAFCIGLYMLVYLLDEMIIFAIAVATMKIKIVSPKFIVFFNLLAALIFIALGIYYLFGRAI